MTEPAPRPTSTRSRGGARGGRGGSRGSTRPRDRQTNGDHKDRAPLNDLADEGDFGEMKKKYAPEIAQLKEMFPDESNEDLAFALDETSGDTFPIIEQITEGRFSRFSDVKTTKERAKPKPKDQSSAGASAESGSKSTRSRGGHDTVRNSARSRPDRGRSSTRGGRGAHGANGVRSSGDPKSVSTDDASWNVSASKQEGGEMDTSTPTDGAGSRKGLASKAKAAPAAAGVKPPAQPDGPPKQSWAQLLRKSEPAPPIQKPPKVAEPAPPIDEPPTIAAAEEDTAPVSSVEDEASGSEPLDDLGGADDPSIEITPSKDQLTEENVEHIPDSSHPAPTETAASTIDSHSATPSVVAATQPIPIGRPQMGGFATSAHRATATPRSASFQRRFMEQQEAVVMPGNHALDKATVQFGSMGLNGDADLDVDEDREDAETRQPPQQSPPSQPRASLPPAPRQPSLPAEQQIADSIQATKPAPGLPPAQQQPAEPPAAQQGSQAGQPYNQFGRIGQNLPSDATAAQKGYDPFGQHQSQQSTFDSYPSHTQAPSQSQQQSQIGGFSSGPNDYSPFYTSDHSRNAFQNYYGAGYGQQGGANQQEAGTSQQRAGSGFGASAADLGYSNQAQTTTQNRYGAPAGENAQTSGQATPNPPLASGASAATSGAPSSQLQQSAPQTQQQPQSQQQPFNQQTPQTHAGTQHPNYNSYQNYYNNPYYASYVNQYPYSQGAGAYGGGPFGRNNYGGGGPAHHGYAMPSHSSYDQQSSSPANVGSFGASSLQDRAPGLGGNLGDYARTGSAQGGSQTGAGFGGMSSGDSFGRSPSGFPSQNTPYSQQQSSTQQQTGTTTESDPLKPFSDSKTAGGPSPGLPGRPGSAANQNSGLPPPQNQHGGFGPYGSQFGQGTYGNLGGLGGQHNQSSYGYGGGFGNYGSYGRGGWGGNYGGH